MSLLSSKNRRIEIKLYYEEKETKFGFSKIIIHEDETKAEALMKEQQDKVKVKKEASEKITPEDEPLKILTTYWKSLSWGEQNQITKRCEKYNPEGVQDLDFFLFRDLRLKNCLVDWDLVDENGQKVKISNETIDQLPSDVVFSLMMKYDSLIKISEDEERKN